MYESLGRVRRQGRARQAPSPTPASSSPTAISIPRAHSFTNRLINEKGEHQRPPPGLGQSRRRLQQHHPVRPLADRPLRIHIPADATVPVTVTATVNYRRFDQHFMDFGMACQAALSACPSSTWSRTSHPQPWRQRRHHSRPAATTTSGCAGITTASPCSMRSSMPTASMPSSTSPSCAPTTPTPPPTSPSPISSGRSTTSPAPIYKALTSPRTTPAPSTTSLWCNATRATSTTPSPICSKSSPSSRVPRRPPRARLLLLPAAQIRRSPRRVRVLQSIDPDDLAAHYNLSIVYRRLGMKDKASHEAAVFADQKDDPTASTYALEFLRKHNEIASESVPWHVHSDFAPKQQIQGVLPSAQ